MKVRNVLKKNLFSLTSLFAVAGISFLMSCQVGLGESVDTSRPVVSIETPIAADVKSGTITISGTCDDDKSVESIKLTLRNSDANVDCGELTSSEREVKISEDNKSWTFEFDTTAYSDAKYLLSAVATDSSGKESPSAQRSFDIDNTAPVLALSKPNTVNINAPSAFGRTVSIKGDVVDDHNIKSMTVNFYAVDADGKVGEKKSVTTNSVDKTSTNFVVAQYLENAPSEGRAKVLYDNYMKLFGDDIIDSTSYNYVTIELEDVAGNVSDCSYIKDDLVRELQNKLGGDATVESSDIKNIINGTYAYVSSSASLSELQNIVKNNAVSKTDFSSTDNTLAASLSTKSNPTYQVGIKSATIKDANGNISYTPYASESSLSVTVQAGKDGTNVDPKTINVFLYELNEKGERISGKEYHKFDGSEIFDGNNVSINNLSPTESASYTVTLPLLKKGLCYEVVVEGTDVKGLELDANPPADYFYAFTAMSSSEPPAVIFNSREKYISLADLKKGYEFTGKITSSAAYDEQEEALRCSIVSVKNKDGNNVDEKNFIYNPTILGTITSDEEFSFTIKADEKVDAEYLDFELRFTATNSEGSGSSSFHFYVDGKAPAISDLEIGEDKAMCKFAENGKSISSETVADYWFGKTVTLKGTVNEFSKYDSDSKFGSGVASNSSGNKVYVTISNGEAEPVVKTFTISNDDTNSSALTSFEKAITLENGINKIKFTLEDAVGNKSESDEYAVQVDTIKPTLSAFTADIRNNKNESVKVNEKENVPVDASLVLGGTGRQKAVFKISADDENGISRMTVEFRSGENLIKEYKSSDTGVTFDAESKTMTLPEINFASDDFKSKSGNITASIAIYDPAGNRDSYERTFALDNVGPEISGIRPKSEEEKTGHVEIYGSAMDSKSELASIEYLIPTSAERSKTDDELNALTSWSDARESGSTVSSWQFNFRDLKDYTNTSYATETQTGSCVWLIPIYFRGTDTLGNMSIYRDYKLRYNPDADKPAVIISRPTDSDYSDGNYYAVVGENFSIEGSVEIPSMTTEVGAVYVQIGTVTTDTNKTKVESIDWTKTTQDGITVAECADVAEKLGKSDSDLTFLSSDKSTSSDWWGIEATAKKGISVSFKSSLNLKLSSSETTRDVAFRVCAFNANGKMGAWSESYVVRIDKDSPVTSVVMKQYSENLTSANFETERANPIATKKYAPDMFLRNKNDNWYFVVTATDTSGINGAAIKVDNSSDGILKHKYSVNDKDAYEIYIPVGRSITSSHTVYVEEIVSDGANPHSMTSTYSVNVDNVGPSIDTLKNRFDVALEKTEVRDSNYESIFKTTATDTGSGFNFMAFYFKRVVDGATTIELPVSDIKTAGSEYSIGKCLVKTVNTDIKRDDSGLYAVEVSGTASNDAEGNGKFTSSSLAGHITSGLVHAGGLVNIDGAYYLIDSVNKTDNSITIEDSLPAVGDKIAKFVMAYIVSSKSVESGSWNSGVNTIRNDNGDGIVELASKSGNSTTCEINMNTSQVEDGPISVECVAFDAAENFSSKSVFVKLANNSPRVSKIYVATDLNGDGIFTDNELKNYSALTEDKKQQQIVNLNRIMSGTSETYVPINTKMIDNLGLGFEFVGGYTSSNSNSALMKTVNEGYGAGNGNVYYKYGISDSALSAPVEKTSDETLLKLSTGNSFATTDNTTAKTVSGCKGFTIAKTAVGTAGKDYEEYSASNDKFNFINITLWDSTKGTVAGEKDLTVNGKSYTNFGSQWTVLNIPIYIDLVDDVAPKSVIDVPTIHSDGGHIDLSSTLPSANFTEKTKTGATVSGEYDRDTKVSGKIVFTGTAKDEKRVSKIYVTTSKKFASGSGLTSAVQVAEYKDGALVVKEATPQAGLNFAIDSQNFSITDGHTVNWSLTVDTSRVEGIAAADVKFTVTVNDGNTDNSSAVSYDDDNKPVNKPECQVDIVPYITGIKRTATTNSVIDYTYRSSYGEYSVAVGDTLKVTGYNLPGADVAATGSDTNIAVGSTKVASKNVTATKEFSIESPSNSGELTVTVNSIRSLNDKNNNAIESNQETIEDDEDIESTVQRSTSVGVLYDNRCIRVWDVNHYFNGSAGGNLPTMATDNEGNLFTTWTLMASGSVQMERGLKSLNKPVYVAYDQPDKENVLAIDKKSGNGTIRNGNASVLLFPANVGSSGTPDSTAYADATTMGGAWAINLYNDFVASNNYNVQNSGKHIILKGNPYYYFDSKVNASGYQLASASMRREVSQFKNGRSVRYGDNMHFVYYDSYNKSLRYTLQVAGKKISSNSPLTEAGNYGTADKTNANGKDIAGWILIDGKSDEQDRIHRWTDNDKELIWSNNGGGVAKIPDGSSIDANGLGFNNTVSNINFSECKAIAFAYTDESGVYRVDLHKISRIVSNHVYWTDHEFPKNSSGKYYAPTGVCYYKGDSNVVPTGTGIAQETGAAVGNYSSIDVTSTGKPVIVYYDSKANTLRIAYSSVATPNMYSVKDGAEKFTRQSLRGIVLGGTYVQAKIDGNNYLHIVYRDRQGKLCYIKSRNNPDGAAYIFNKADIMTIDTAGTYETLSLIRKGSAGSYIYAPCISFLNSEGTENGVKYAELRTVDEGQAVEDGTLAAATLTSAWDTYIIPAVKDNFIIGGEYVYTEGFNGWTKKDAIITDGVDTADCDAIIGYNTGRMDVLFLKSEK